MKIKNWIPALVRQGSPQVAGMTQNDSFISLAMTNARLPRCARNDRRGFTLVELIMAMTVVSIILAAVATLAFALSSANSTADNTSEIQSRIRYTTLQFNELVRNCKLVCYNPGSEVVLWRADNNGDNKINPGELVYIDTGSDNHQIRIISFKPTGAAASATATIAALGVSGAKETLITYCSPSYITLINNCGSVQFTTDTAAPYSKKLNMYFTIQQKGVTQKYQCSAFLRAQAGYLLNGSGEIISSDDDM